VTIGRRQPYTVKGIGRVACMRCGKRPAVHQWNCCAISNRWIAICVPCDIALNALVLRWLGVSDRAHLIAAYRIKATGGPMSKETRRLFGAARKLMRKAALVNKGVWTDKDRRDWGAANNALGRLAGKARKR
jgi:hypothetical protein